MNLFAPLPPDFDQLAHAVRLLRGADFGVEPDLRTVGERTYAAFEAVGFQAHHSPALRQRHWRHLPYALWLSPERGLAQQPELLRHYGAVILPQALDSRRPLHWGRALLHAYFQQFKPQDPVFGQVAQWAQDYFLHPRIWQALAQTQANGLLRLLGPLRALEPGVGPQAMADDILALPPERSLVQWQAQQGLTDHFWLNPFSQAAFVCATQAPLEVRRTPAYVKRLCEWALHAPGTAQQRFRYPVCRDELAWALLSPWFDTPPPPEMQHLLLAELLRLLGDPRQDTAGWLGVRREAIETASRWLTARALDACFALLSRSGDPHAPWRRAFWEAYFQAGHILEAWLVVGEAVADEWAAQPEENAQGQYGRILGPVAPHQSLLMVRMGGILFCDWSHDGRLRAIAAQHKQAPKLYQASYPLVALRFPTALNLNEGQSDDPGLLHLHSAEGGWQDAARRFIEQHLGIAMPLAQLLPAQAG